MRIAFVVHTFPSLSQTFILNQITGLLDRGCEVDIYADRPEDASGVHPEVETHQLLRRTLYPKLPQNYLLRVLKGIGLLAANAVKAHQVLFRSCNILRHGLEAASLKLLYDAVTCLDQRPYDIIHCHFGPNGLKGMRLREIGALQGKLITTFYGYDVSRYPRECGDNCYEHLFQTGDLFLVISETMRHRLIELGCKEAKLLLHPLGIDPGRFTPAVQGTHTGQPVRVVTVGRLVPKKGIEYGVRAVAKLLKANRLIEYVVVGDGPLRGPIQQLIDALDAGCAIKLAGWKEWPEVVNILGCSDILLAPSITSKSGDEEGTPVVLLEAMGMGLPVVSTLHSGIPELIENGVSGLLLPEGDWAAVAGALEYLIEHPEVREKMGRAGRESVKIHHDIHKLNDRLVEIYHKLWR